MSLAWEDKERTWIQIVEWSVVRVESRISQSQKRTRILTSWWVAWFPSCRIQWRVRLQLTSQTWGHQMTTSQRLKCVLSDWWSREPCIPPFRRRRMSSLQPLLPLIIRNPSGKYGRQHPGVCYVNGWHVSSSSWTGIERESAGETIFSIVCETTRRLEFGVFEEESISIRFLGGHPFGTKSAAFNCINGKIPHDHMIPGRERITKGQLWCSSVHDLCLTRFRLSVWFSLSLSPSIVSFLLIMWIACKWLPIREELEHGAGLTALPLEWLPVLPLILSWKQIEKEKEWEETSVMSCHVTPPSSLEGIRRLERLLQQPKRCHM